MRLRTGELRCPELKKAVIKQHADLSWGLLCNLCRTSQSSAKADIAKEGDRQVGFKEGSRRLP